VPVPSVDPIGFEAFLNAVDGILRPHLNAGSVTGAGLRSWALSCSFSWLVFDTQRLSASFSWFDNLLNSIPFVGSFISSDR
jgi:hypothetical protein